ncbi:MAG: hypothetical protein ACK4N5_24015, partial [Myxococcales bacterium]
DVICALESAFRSIRDARGRDPDLVRAMVVLITDGEDHVELERIRAARAPVGELEITLNFISLGRENRDLKQLVLEQREAGRRAFYYHLNDREVSGVRSDFDAGEASLLPQHPQLTMPADEALLRQAVEGLQALADERRVAPRAGGSAARFNVYFPAVVPREPGQAPARVTDVLEAVAETTRLAPAELRAEEAVTLLEHLLKLYGMSPAAYLAALPRLEQRGREAIEELRLLCPTAPAPDAAPEGAEAPGAQGQVDSPEARG